MGKDDEVIPDSQDEDEGHLSQSPFRDLSPLPEHLPPSNATIPRSSSYVLPQRSPVQPTPIPIRRAAPSTISQFTMETVKNTKPTPPSAISAFPSSSSSSDPPKKPRPKPRPTYKGADTSNNPSFSVIHTTDGSITSPSISTSSRALNVLPPPQATFSADISERIKARRAPAPMPSKSLEKQDKSQAKNAKKKTVPPVEDVIDISSDTDIPAGPSRSVSTSKHPSKVGGTRQSPDPLNIGIATHVSPSISLQRDLEADFSDLSPPPPRKRKRHPAVLPTDLDSKAHLAISLADAINASNDPGPDGDERSARPPKKKKSKKVDDAGEALPAQEKPKKKKKTEKASDNPQEPKKPRAKPKGKEKDQFKSNEFIVDSDDELGLGPSGEVSGAGSKIVPTASASAITVVTSASVASVKAPTEVGPSPKEAALGTAAGMDAKSEATQASSKKKTTGKKRKAVVDTEDEGLHRDATGRPSPKKAKRAEASTKASTKKKQPKEGPEKAPGAAVVDKAVVEQSPVLGAEETVVNAKRKKGGRMIIEDDENDEDGEAAKENVAPAVTKVLKAPIIKAPVPTATPQSKPPVSTAKPSYAHPPKNRPLSSILQRVNSASPRPRASPSMSRNLLTRIAPLHPNRRTPPPPPPPRIVPKKTKKELEREEKWEEELQESVEGWCELEEGERERMRRAKRDWELGLCEE